MSTFNKSQVVDQGSLEKFARWAECYKVYRLPNDHDFIAIRSERDEQAMFGSQWCRGAELVYARGQNIPFNWESLLEHEPEKPRSKSRFFYGKTEEEAKAAAQNAGIPAENIQEIKVTHTVQLKVAEATNKDKAKAIAAVESQVPSSAFNIHPASIRIFTGETGQVEIQAEDEMAARQQWKEMISEGRKDLPKAAPLEEFICIIPPQKGFLGVGKKPGSWKAKWNVPFTAVISYQLPAEVKLTYIDQPFVKPVETKKAESVDLIGKTLVIELSLPEGKSTDAALGELSTTAIAQQQGMGHGSDIVLASLLKAAPPRKVFVVDNVQATIEADDSVATMVAKLTSLSDFDKRVISNILAGAFWVPIKGDAFFDILCRLPVDCYGRWSQHSKADRGVILLHTRYR